jgi:hypothetical protein
MYTKSWPPKLEGPLERTWRKGNIKIGVKEMTFGRGDGFVTEMSFRVPSKTGNISADEQLLVSPGRICFDELIS